RAALDALGLRLVVELLVGTPGGAGVRALAAAVAGRYVLDAGLARGLRLAVARSLLVDGAGGDLLRDVGAAAALLQPLLDVRVLAFTLVAPCGLRHVGAPLFRLRLSCILEATDIPARACIGVAHRDWELLDAARWLVRPGD